VSLANLNDADYMQIGRNLKEICVNAAEAWRKARDDGAARRFGRADGTRTKRPAQRGAPRAAKSSSRKRG
jgi:hypothetical protein